MAFGRAGGHFRARHSAFCHTLRGPFRVFGGFLGPFFGVLRRHLCAREHRLRIPETGFGLFHRQPQQGFSSSLAQELEADFHQAPLGRYQKFYRHQQRPLPGRELFGNVHVGALPGADKDGTRPALDGRPAHQFVPRPRGRLAVDKHGFAALRNQRPGVFTATRCIDFGTGRLFSLDFDVVRARHQHPVRRAHTVAHSRHGGTGTGNSSCHFSHDITPDEQPPDWAQQETDRPDDRRRNQGTGDDPRQRGQKAAVLDRIIDPSRLRPVAPLG
ncbi:hypothetical protein Xhom_00973 [Xenorhabdus hominickii]|uniref:Uncharacterized protein n=1 Tax=Xenorhabdus hominickii TaxID=351679 RepID=A0A2G0QFN1_XENHO|nr:hypothetical protein Xhom_00973 [Xenorhabdus hominickii]